ncbi:MAG: protein kinase [Microlunatus sp.]|nr:protein kinase [Microlunatus sp.]
MADVDGTASIAGDDGPPPGPWSLSAGTLLANRYRLDRQIGTGGMGRVWAARDTVLCRDVAVKLHHIDSTGGQAELKQFLQEARATAALQHAHVVTVYDSGTDGDQTYLVMELLPGPSLEAYVSERRPLPEAEAVALAVQIASGIAAAHGAGVLHRDIKPSNVMFDVNGRLKIIDFGIARLTTTTATAVASANAMAGSPPYLSPEQFQGRPADERSDLYAFGCLLTTLLTGQPPFRGEHPLAFGHQHVYAPPPLISDRCPGVDPELDRLVTQLLKKDPRDRPRSALDVLERLSGLKPNAAAAGVQRAVVAQPAASEPSAPTAATSGDRPHARRHSRAVSRVVAAALAPVLTAAILTAGTTRAEAPELRAATGSFQQVQRHRTSSHSSHVPQAGRTNTRDQTIGTAGPDQSRTRRDTAATSSAPSRPDGRRHQGNQTKPNAVHPTTTPTSAPKPTATATTSPKPTSSPTTGPTATAPTTSTPKPTTSPTTDPTSTDPTSAAPTSAPTTRAPATRSQ